MEEVKKLVFRHYKRIFMVAMIALLGLSLRWIGVTKLDSDIDEGIYVPKAEAYYNMMKEGDIQGIINYKENIEHPIFLKLSFAAGLFVADKIGVSIDRPREQMRVTRIVSLIYTIPHIVLLSVINPIAGLTTAVSTWHIKYSSETMFDGPSTALATLALILFIWSYKRKKLLYLSAVAMGLAFASKYITATTAITILIFMAIKAKDDVRYIKNIVIYGIVALAVFFIADPILWTDPAGRLKESLFFHAAYSQGSDVQRAHSPIYMQLVWLAQSVPWHKGVFLINADLAILILSVIGLPFLFIKNKILGAWFVVNFVFLMIYPTKWPQYTLVIIPAMGFSVGALLEFAWVKLKKLHSFSTVFGK